MSGARVGGAEVSEARMSQDKWDRGGWGQGGWGQDEWGLAWPLSTQCVGAKSPFLTDSLVMHLLVYSRL